MNTSSRRSQHNAERPQQLKDHFRRWDSCTQFFFLFRVFFTALTTLRNRLQVTSQTCDLAVFLYNSLLFLAFCGFVLIVEY